MYPALHGHQGTEKTLEQLRQEAYWVNMARDVEQYCRECAPCQQAKLPGLIRVPVTSVPIGRPWPMIAVDILEVPLSPNNNRYVLVSSPGLLPSGQMLTYCQTKLHHGLQQSW